jgi:hypothetical protein
MLRTTTRQHTDYPGMLHTGAKPIFGTVWKQSRSFWHQPELHVKKWKCYILSEQHMPTDKLKLFKCPCKEQCA